MAQPTAEVRAARRRLRALRLAIEPRERTAAEAAIRATLDRLRIFRRGGRVALYLPLPGEVDLRSCLPDGVASRRRDLRAADRQPAAPPDDLRAAGAGKHGATEQLRHRGTCGRDPLRSPRSGSTSCSCRSSASTVAATASAWAPGSTTGRCDGDSTPGAAWRRPRLVGVAFACQELPEIAASPWDVPLDLIVTERGIVVPEHRPVTRQRSAR